MRVVGDRDEGVEAERAAVVGRDPVQVGARDRLRGGQAGLHVGAQLRDRLVEDVVARGRDRQLGGLLGVNAGARGGGAGRGVVQRRPVGDRAAERPRASPATSGARRQRRGAGLDRGDLLRRPWRRSRRGPRRRSAAATSSGPGRASACSCSRRSWPPGRSTGSGAPNGSRWKLPVPDWVPMTTARRAARADARSRRRVGDLDPGVVGADQRVAARAVDDLALVAAGVLARGAAEGDVDRDRARRSCWRTCPASACSCRPC